MPLSGDALSTALCSRFILLRHYFFWSCNLLHSAVDLYCYCAKVLLFTFSGHANYTRFVLSTEVLLFITVCVGMCIHTCNTCRSNMIDVIVNV